MYSSQMIPLIEFYLNWTPSFEWVITA